MHHTVQDVPYSATNCCATSGSVTKVLDIYVLVSWIGLILGYVVRRLVIIIIIIII